MKPGKFQLLINNSFLLGLIITLVSTLFLIRNDEVRSIFSRIFFSLVILIASYSINEKHRRVIYFVLALIVFREITGFLSSSDLMIVLGWGLIIIFFIVIVFKLISHVAGSKIVRKEEILESINGYLLYGLCGSILIAIVCTLNTNALSVPVDENNLMASSICFSFITITTIGFGDITPISNPARLLALFIGVGGQ